MPEDLIGFGKAAEQLIKSGEKFLDKLIGPYLEERGQLWADKVRRRRENMAKIAVMAEAIVADKPVVEVPGRILFPLLNAASNEDESSLQGKWAALLAHS